MSGLFPFAVVKDPENQLTMQAMNGEDVLSEELLEVIQNFEENVGELFEIEDCNDPDVVELILPAFFQFLESTDISEDDLEVAQSMVVYSAVYFEDQNHLVVMVQFDAGVEDDEDDSDDTADSDESEEEWD